MGERYLRIKLRQDPEAKARDSKQAFQRWPHAFRRELLLLSGRALARREFNKHEHQRQHHQYGADNQIGPDHLTPAITRETHARRLSTVYQRW